MNQKLNILLDLDTFFMFDLSYFVLFIGSTTKIRPTLTLD
jgi:hypothetical protein